MLSALIIQPELSSPAGLVGDRLQHHGYELHAWIVSASRNGDIPVATDFDLVVPLGSAQSVYDIATVGSWIEGELDVLRAAHAGGVPVFGICFGAQALCAALGGVVERSPVYEVGWVSVETDDDSVVPPGPWFTWHGDRCIVPEGVDVVARNEVAAQAFEVGSSVAVQFHPEVTRDIVHGWIAESDPAWFERVGVDPDAMLDDFDRHRATVLVNLHRMLDRFLDDTAK